MRKGLLTAEILKRLRKRTGGQKEEKTVGESGKGELKRKQIAEIRSAREVFPAKGPQGGEEEQSANGEGGADNHGREGQTCYIAESKREKRNSLASLRKGPRDLLN